MPLDTLEKILVWSFRDRVLAGGRRAQTAFSPGCCLQCLWWPFSPEVQSLWPLFSLHGLWGWVQTPRWAAAALGGLWGQRWPDSSFWRSSFSQTAEGSFLWTLGSPSRRAKWNAKVKLGSSVKDWPGIKDFPIRVFTPKDFVPPLRPSPVPGGGSRWADV